MTHPPTPIPHAPDRPRNQQGGEAVGGPCRFRLSRRPGATMPPGGISVARPSRWGNPYAVGAVYSAAEAVARHRGHMDGRLQGGQRDQMAAELETLRGRDLGCWCALCPDHVAGKPFGATCSACPPCHADTLGEMANRPTLACEAAEASP